MLALERPGCVFFLYHSPSSCEFIFIFVIMVGGYAWPIKSDFDVLNRCYYVPYVSGFATE